MEIMGIKNSRVFITGRAGLIGCHIAGQWVHKSAFAPGKKQGRPIYAALLQTTPGFGIHQALDLLAYGMNDMPRADAAKAHFMILALCSLIGWLVMDIRQLKADNRQYKSGKNSFLYGL
jgi:hypothetical protein